MIKLEILRSTSKILRLTSKFQVQSQNSKIKSRNTGSKVERLRTHAFWSASVFFASFLFILTLFTKFLRTPTGNFLCCNISFLLLALTPLPYACVPGYASGLEYAEGAPRQSRLLRRSSQRRTKRAKQLRQALQVSG